MNPVSTAPAGAPLPPFEVPCVDARRMATMSALLDDPVPIHYDPSAVRATGGALVDQGPMALGYLSETVARWTGDRHALRRLRCRFHAPVRAGDRLVCSGKVVAVHANGTRTVELAVRSDAGTVVSGTALVRLPPGAIA